MYPCSQATPKFYLAAVKEKKEAFSTEWTGNNLRLRRMLTQDVLDHCHFTCELTKLFTYVVLSIFDVAITYVLCSLCKQGKAGGALAIVV